MLCVVRSSAHSRCCCVFSFVRGVRVVVCQGGTDGTGTLASFAALYNVQPDMFGDYVYITDIRQIRRLDVRTLAVTTVSGNAMSQGMMNRRDCSGTTCLFNELMQMQIDGDNKWMYVGGVRNMRVSCYVYYVSCSL